MKFIELEVPPPGVGLKTVIGKIPEVPIGTFSEANNSIELLKDVPISLPLK